MCHRVGNRMRCELAAVPAARAWLVDQLQRMYALPGDMAEDAVLVLSELVTNCVRADCHYFALLVVGHHDRLRVEATDDAPGQPSPRRGEPGDVHGRGLGIVDAVASQWGVRPAPAGKTVWVELAVPDTAVPTFGCDRAPGQSPDNYAAG